MKAVFLERKRLEHFSPAPNLQGNCYKLKLVDGHTQDFSGAVSHTHGRRSLALRLFLCSITIIAAGVLHPHLHAQGVAREAPPRSNASTSASSLPPAPAPQGEETPLELGSIPRATVIHGGRDVPPVDISYDVLSRHGDVYLLSGDVVITSGERTFRADSITYNQDTADITAEGHLRLSGGVNGESIEASHGTYNLNTQTGRFYDVSGSVGLKTVGKATSRDLTTDNPVLFSGRMVVKTGPQDYVVYDGSITSCLLPRADWQLFSGRFTLNGDKAAAKNSTFKLVGIPVLFLPYVTHPIDPQKRQSGLLIPTPDYTNNKGLILGEEAYIVFGRSADLTFGGNYYSKRGYSEAATFRYRGVGNDFFAAHFSALQDRGYIDSTSGLYINQGGQDVTAGFRRKLTKNTRAVGDGEYLSSYTYRQAFNDNFNQAVSSDITSIGYLVRQNNGFSMAARADRYQGLKRVPIGTEAGQQVRIFHAPSLDFTALDHHVGNTPLLWSIEASAAGLKRVQPNFISSGVVERLDLRPALALPLQGGGFHMMSSIALRETFYSRSRVAPYGAGATPVELTEPVNRLAVDGKVVLLPPAIERTFTVPPKLQKLFGMELRHTVAPELTYRNVHGINNFLSVLRFDEADLVSDTNELEYGVTQHLYGRRPAKAVTLPPGCIASEETVDAGFGTAGQSAPPQDVLDPSPESGTDANGIPDMTANAPAEPVHSHAGRAVPCPPAGAPQHEWLSWRLAQRHFFDPTFGNAIIPGRRNIFESTLSLSGIAFLTEPRNISPLISRLRMRTSSHTDVEWDFDLDTGAAKFTSSNVFMDAHEGPYFAAVSFARLNAPGRFRTEVIDTVTNKTTLINSPVSDFTQMRLLLGYGTAGKPGLSMAANTGLDLKNVNVQYGTFQATYNWNCCGISAEYRKYELGSVRNENAYRFSFTLANIATVGNLRRSERLF